MPDDTNDRMSPRLREAFRNIDKDVLEAMRREKEELGDREFLRRRLWTWWCYFFDRPATDRPVPPEGQEPEEFRALLEWDPESGELPRVGQSRPRGA
ncbi:MAG TPA: hypothetical protein VK539_10855 [Myxococcaceae bacterium]|nr:hypothetical protein [Myxococcaceae bacterium]